MDSTACRAHQHAADARKKGAPDPAQPDGHTLGRSCGDLSTKLAGDSCAQPLTFHVTTGQTGDTRPSRPPWPLFAFREADPADREPDPMPPWRTIRTSPARSGTTSASSPRARGRIHAGRRQPVGPRPLPDAVVGALGWAEEREPSTVGVFSGGMYGVAMAGPCARAEAGHHQGFTAPTRTDAAGRADHTSVRNTRTVRSPAGTRRQGRVRRAGVDRR